jgi:hypothetical protein
LNIVEPPVRSSPAEQALAESPCPDSTPSNAPMLVTSYHSIEVPRFPLLSVATKESVPEVVVVHKNALPPGVSPVVDAPGIAVQVPFVRIMPVKVTEVEATNANTITGCPLAMETVPVEQVACDELGVSALQDDAPGEPFAPPPKWMT